MTVSALSGVFNAQLTHRSDYRSTIAAAVVSREDSSCSQRPLGQLKPGLELLPGRRCALSRPDQKGAVIPLPQSRSRLRKILFTLVDLYAAGMIGYLVLRPINAIRWLWPVVAIGTFLHLVLLPAIPLFLLALLLKSWRSSVLLGIGAAAYLLQFGGLFLPGPSRSNSTSQLTVMTYNTAQGRAEWDGLERAIRESGADIVAIQESVDEQVPLYRRDLSDLYPYQAFYDSGVDGIGMLSRFPFEEEGVQYLASWRAYLIADVEVGGRTLTVISAHPPVMLFGPGGPAGGGRADYGMLADLAMERGNTIVAGDLNLTDQDEGYSTIIKRGLADARREVGFGFGLTFPTELNTLKLPPLIRIDYILTTPDLQPIETWVGQDGGSDHLPVLATIGWTESDGG